MFQKVLSRVSSSVARCEEIKGLWVWPGQIKCKGIEIRGSGGETPEKFLDATPSSILA